MIHTFLLKHFSENLADYRFKHISMGEVSYKLSKIPLINRQSFLSVARCVALRRGENVIKLGLTKNFLCIYCLLRLLR